MVIFQIQIVLTLSFGKRGGLHERTVKVLAHYAQ